MPPNPTDTEGGRPDGGRPSGGQPSDDQPSTDLDRQIEHAASEDVDQIVDMWLTLATEQRDHGSHVLPEPNRSAIREVLAAHRVGDGLLVARVDGELVGFASFSVEHGSLDLDATRGQLSNLYVQPGARGAGVGTALLHAVEAELADRDVDLLTLEAMADNEAARRFYRRHGYETFRVGLERELDTDGESDIHSRDHD